MDMEQLIYFRETARREHFTQAAQALNITQPALSKSIARLEDELGVKLFRREGKVIHLNEYGQVMLRYTDQLLGTVEDMQSELNEMKNGTSGSIRIGSSFPVGEPNWVLDQVRSFALHRPNINLKFNQLPLSRIKQSLESREVDLAISTVPLLDPGVCWTELFQEEMGIIHARNHPLAALPELSLVDLRNERFYCNNANSDVIELTYQFCHRAGFRPNVHFECEFPSFIGESISRGYGISLISKRGQIQNEQKPNRQPWEDNVVYRPLKEDYCKRICGVAYLENRRIPQAAWDFYCQLKKAYGK